MLYKFNKENKTLNPLEFCDYSELNGNEKDLENLLAENLGDLYVESGQLMSIFQERRWQEEPDLCALDSMGNLVIFELKRGIVPGDTTIQVMRYSQIYKQYTYDDLNRIYLNYSNSPLELKEAHADAFQLETPLREEQFNLKQKMVIVGFSSDTKLIDNVEYWKNAGVDIDFLPYRFYRIADDYYFDFFAKPYDYHPNPKDVKGIMFDTNRYHDENAVWDMFKNSKISAYGKAGRFVERFNEGDYVLYYYTGRGIIGAGKIKSNNIYTNKANDEMYKNVELLTPVISSESESCIIPPREIKRLLNKKNFWWQSTVKTPYLSAEESNILVNALQEMYKKR